MSDIGTHWLDLVTWIIGKKVTEICADLATVVPVRQRPRGRVETFQKADSKNVDSIPITTDDYASVLFHLEGDLHGVMTVSQVSAGRKTRLWFEIDGTEGSLSWNSEEPNSLWIGRRQPGQRRTAESDPSTDDAQRRDDMRLTLGATREGYPDTFVQLFRAIFTEYIRSRKPEGAAQISLRLRRGTKRCCFARQLKRVRALVRGFPYGRPVNRRRLQIRRRRDRLELSGRSNPGPAERIYPRTGISVRELASPANTRNRSRERRPPEALPRRWPWDGFFPDAERDFSTSSGKFVRVRYRPWRTDGAARQSGSDW